MDDCIFCKIVKGELPCYKVLEDDSFLACLDINPMSDGHTLVISKKHYQWVWDVENFGEYWEFAKKVSQLLMEKMPSKWLNYLTVGREVPHAHIHIIPRYEGDNLDGIADWSKSKKLSTEEMAKILDKIIK